LSIFRNSVEVIQVSLKSHTNKGYFTGRPTYIFHHISHTSFRMRNVSGKRCTENQNKHFTFINYFENRAVYEIMWKNIVKPGTPQTTIWYMCIAW